MAPKRKDLTGLVFERLTVLEFVGLRNRNIWWRCCCKCGKEVTVSSQALRCRGNTKSCGCLQREKAAEQARQMGAGNVTHGMTNTREYETWHHMHQRCSDPNLPNYPHYGGRGIKVCERWCGENGFSAFYADLGPRPSSKHQLDRIDPNGDYKAGNCRWVTSKEQQRNRRLHVLLTYEGRTQCLAAWAEEFGLTIDRLWNRLGAGWPLEEALLTPLLRRGLRARQP